MRTEFFPYFVLEFISDIPEDIYSETEIEFIRAMPGRPVRLLSIDFAGHPGKDAVVAYVVVDAPAGLDGCVTLFRDYFGGTICLSPEMRIRMSWRPLRVLGAIDPALRAQEMADEGRWTK